MDLVNKMYMSFLKLKKDPKGYFEFKDQNNRGYITVKEFRHTVYEFCKLDFTDREFEVLVRRYENEKEEGVIDYSPLVEDLDK